MKRNTATDSEDQARVIQLFRDGKRDQAMKLFVTLYQEKIYSVAYRMFLNHDDALDASQEALIQADRSLGNFRGESSLSTWVYRLTTNVCLNYCRKQASRRTVIDPWDSRRVIENLRASRHHEPEVVCETLARKRTLEAALQKIPEHLRLLVILHDLEMLSVPEIARIVERSPAAVKSALHRARQSLKSILAAGVTAPGDEAAGPFVLESSELG